jgi:hypothetical protein
MTDDHHSTEDDLIAQKAAPTGMISSGMLWPGIYTINTATVTKMT